MIWYVCDVCVSLCIHLTDLWTPNAKSHLPNHPAWEARMRAVAPSLHGKSTEAFAASSASTMSLRCQRANDCDVKSFQILVLVKLFVGTCWDMLGRNLDMLGQLTQLLTAKLKPGMSLTIAITSIHLRCLTSNTKRLNFIPQARCETDTEATGYARFNSGHARRTHEATWGKKGWKKIKKSCLTAWDFGCQESKSAYSSAATSCSSKLVWIGTYLRRKEKQIDMSWVVFCYIEDWEARWLTQHGRQLSLERRPGPCQWRLQTENPAFAQFAKKNEDKKWGPEVIVWNNSQFPNLIGSSESYIVVVPSIHMTLLGGLHQSRGIHDLLILVVHHSIWLQKTWSNVDKSSVGCKKAALGIIHGYEILKRQKSSIALQLFTCQERPSGPTGLQLQVHWHHLLPPGSLGSQQKPSHLLNLSVWWFCMMVDDGWWWLMMVNDG